MSELLDTGKCVVCVLAGLVVAMGASIGALALVLNLMRLALP